MKKTDKQVLMTMLHREESHLVREIQNYFTITNMGQDFGQIYDWRQLCEYDEAVYGVFEEYDYWEKDAKRIAKEIRARGLPPTLESADVVWSDPQFHKKNAKAKSKKR